MLKFSELERVHIELSSACQAACPVCPRNVDGGYTIPWLKQRTLTLEDFKKIINEETALQLKSMLMCGNYGDPIFCRELPEILKYLDGVNPHMHVSVHTNGGARSPAWWTELANAHQNFSVVFSIDGLEDTNHVYRRNVNWERLMDNAKAFTDAGGHAIWEFLIFKHNQHQIEDVKKLAAELNFRETRFKRPFGFESVHNSYESMRVLDEQGQVDYYIYPADDDSLRNKNFGDEDVSRYPEDFDSSLPLYAYEEFFNNTVKYYDMVFEEEAKAYEYLDSTEISCMTKNAREIYIDSNGNVHPCCFLGIGSQNVTAAFDTVQYNKWLKDNVDPNHTNAKIFTVKEILDTEFFTKIENTWNKKHSEGRMMCCSKMCVKNQSARDKLYIKDDK